MRKSLAKYWGYTSIAAIVIVGTTNLNVSLAGGDPSIKDKKIYQSNSNIKQHDHDKIYKKQNKNKTLKNSKSLSNSKVSNKEEESTVSGFGIILQQFSINPLASITPIIV